MSKKDESDNSEDDSSKSESVGEEPPKKIEELALSPSSDSDEQKEDVNIKNEKPKTEEKESSSVQEPEKESKKKKKKKKKSTKSNEELKIVDKQEEKIEGEESKSPKSSKKKKKTSEKEINSSKSSEEGEKSPKLSEGESPKSTEEGEKSPKSPKKSKKKIEDKSGFLEKKGAFRHNWLQRWFVLHDGKLNYYKTKSDPQPKGTIPLTNVVIYPHVEKNGQELSNYFNIRVSNRDYLIRASTLEDKDSWVKAIKASSKVDSNAPKEKPKFFKQSSFMGVVKEKENVK